MSPGVPKTVTVGQELEETLEQILKQVLGIDAVGLDDNFFELGADSARLLEVHERVQQIVEREIQLVDIFNHPTIRALAAHLGESSPAPAPVMDRGKELRSGRNRLARRRKKR